MAPATDDDFLDIPSSPLGSPFPNELIDPTLRNESIPPITTEAQVGDKRPSSTAIESLDLVQIASTVSRRLQLSNDNRSELIRISKVRCSMSRAGKY